MAAIKFFHVFFLILMFTIVSQGQLRYSTLIKSSTEDEIIILSVDAAVYYPGDSVYITIQRATNSAKVSVTPILILEEAVLKSVEKNIYSTIVPEGCPPGRYPVKLRVKDTQGRRFDFTTDCSVTVEEHQLIERISKYVQISPVAGSEDINSPVTLERYYLNNFKVVFVRDNIEEGMGPQFLNIETTVQSRDGSVIQTYNRRVLTFRSSADPGRDRAMLIQYRNAYGAYAAIRMQEFSEVQISTDSLPDWASVRIKIEPDYLIKIGGYDKSNAYIRYFRIRGPRIELGLSLGIPKVLFDTSDDPMEYGNSSAMLRFYYVEDATGNRFPVNLGIGTFGVNSPIDVSAKGGGFALSVFLNAVEVTRLMGYDILKKVTAGIELTPFFPLKHQARILLNIQVGLAL